MPLFLKHTKPLFGVWKIEENQDELLSLLTNKEAVLPFLEHMRTENRRKEWLAVRVLLKELTGEEKQVGYHPDGAPFLIGSDLYISISHTKGYAALLVSDRPEAGIDIEYRGTRIVKVRDRFMTPEEEAAIDPCHEVEQLLIHWCVKETLFKILRKKEVDFRKHLHVSPFLYNELGSLTACETLSDPPVSYRLNYVTYPGFILVFSFPSAGKVS
ncbi:MAG: 4'-phosphopantetheinyl transferase superfamily protein [Tannerellaceae bacterium]|jgi:4'-phosphopantetheinyl transferase EntD|nr:4'-phosphopantetheinyl transferase superfamily protein [Tannerellaceae bacterium]